MPLMPGCALGAKSNVGFYRDSRNLPLAVTAAVEAESAVCLIFVSQGWGSVQIIRVYLRVSACICVHLWLPFAGRQRNNTGIRGMGAR